MDKIKIEVPTTSYNQRRYGKPWIAVVDFAGNPKGEYKWGNWVGDHNNGSAGLLVIEAHEGDVIASGQKDFRNARNSTPDYYQVRDGKLAALRDKAAAYAAFQARQAEPQIEPDVVAEVPNTLADVSTDALIAELARRGILIPSIA